MSLKYAITCPGQGFIKNGLLQSIIKYKPLYQSYLDDIDSILGENFSANLFKQQSEQDVINWLNKTSNAQPAILSSTYIISKVIEQTSNPQFINNSQYILGHSLGEYSALLLSGILDFKTAIQLVRLRGNLMEQLFEKDKIYGMTALLIKPNNYDQVKLYAEECNLLANINSSFQIVLSGELKEINKLVDNLKSKKLILKSINLPVSVPFHSHYLETIVPELRQFLDGKINKQNIPIIANLTGKVSTNQVTTINNTLQANYQPVQWLKSMTFLENSNIDTLYNLGPGNVLHLINKRYKLRSINIDDIESIDGSK
ncbi:unnamed protein product [Candida verbasci]|uniref:[acyl-carrier-protein] S-malonyltransferase n=1 Tax=Candida verbasci TaxID=1227364 RepID=A0A9W4XJ63_9ASCO|nr:unnamed protein product [Candida verbasci]